MIWLWSKSLTDMDLLRRALGGRYAKCGTGYQWTLQKHEDLKELAELISPLIHEEEDHNLALLNQLFKDDTSDSERESR